MGILEEKLIFIISQPRSGSSMLQQLLMQSKEISSKPEPWVMLPLVYIYKKNDHNCGYNNSYSQINLSNYLELNGSNEAFLKKRVKELAIDIYTMGVEGNNYFIDKTPRYYHIANELIELFPRSKFIFLTRNPLAVFQSILHYNFYGDITKMITADRRCDIFDAIDILAELKTKNPHNCIFINYEKIVKETISQLKEIFTFLEIEYPEQIGSYSIKKEFQNTNATDLKSLFKHDRPSARYLDEWKNSIKTTQDLKILKEYLYMLDEKKLEILGYSNLANELLGLNPKMKILKYSLGSILHKETSLKYSLLKKIERYCK